jgi:hypothetical protein
MKLTPRTAPGRSTRKARAYASEIVRLHAEGHSCEAIRQALHDIGVQVSGSTVQREVARHASRKRSSPARTPASFPAPVARSPPHAPSPPPPTQPPARTASPALRHGRDIVEEFFKDRIDNPLIRSKDSS